MCPFVFARGDPLRQATDYSLRPGQPIYAVDPAWAWLAFKTSTFIAFLRAKLLVGV